MRQPLSLLGTRAGTALLLALVTFALPVAARAQVVHHDFEDGTTEGWVRRGTAILAVTNEAAATGLNSLKTTGRTAPWNGPGLDVMPTVQKDLLYQIRVSVRLTAGQAALQDTLRMTIERRVAGETSDRFDSIAASATSGVTSGSWVALQGSGTLIGFDFQVNNDELGNGVRSSVATWNDPTGESFRNTSRFGVLKLVPQRAHPPNSQAFEAEGSP